MDVSFDDFKDFARPSSDFRDKIRVPTYTKEGIETKFLGKDEACMLSKKDYQALCAFETLKHSENVLLSLCVDKNKEAADKILPGFYDKYSENVSLSGRRIAMEDEVSQAVQKEIADNFAKINPNFYNDVLKRYDTVRKNRGYKTSEEISDSQFYALTGGKMFMCDEHSEGGELMKNFRNLCYSCVEKCFGKGAREKFKSDCKQYNKVVSVIKNLKNGNKRTEKNEPEKTQENAAHQCVLAYRQGGR